MIPDQPRGFGAVTGAAGSGGSFTGVGTTTGGGAALVLPFLVSVAFGSFAGVMSIGKVVGVFGFTVPGIGAGAAAHGSHAGVQPVGAQHEDFLAAERARRLSRRLGCVYRALPQEFVAQGSQQLDDAFFAHNPLMRSSNLV